MKTRIIGHWILIADLAWCVVAFIGAEGLRYGRLWDLANRSSTESLLPFLGGTAAVWLLISSWMKLDCFRGGWRFPAVVSQVLLAVLSLMFVLLSAGYLWREYVSRLVLIYFTILLFGGFVGVRYVARLLLLAKYRSGNVRRLVIVGTDRIARELALKIKRHPEMVCEVVGFLSPEDDGTVVPRELKDAVTVPTIGIADLLAAQRVTDLMLALPRSSMPEVLNLAGRCRERGITVSFVPQPYELYLSKPTLIDLDGIPILELSQASAHDLLLVWKRIIDIALGLILTIVATPILLPVTVGLRWTRSRAFRWEQRCGKHGVIFPMLRLNVDRGIANSTQFERVLVTMSVTELPQLWNVLRGEMTLVGPRPDPPEKVKRYSEWEQQRLSIKPGMTGLAQVHGLRDQNSLEEKTRFDLQYILTPSAVTDASILLQTLWILATRLLEHFRLIVPDRNREGSPVMGEVTASQFLEENLQSAHRSQSSAD
jgi:lipopolysaccharide/colanic/teichoic acid biosynthesis glycosyltransferase